MSAVNVSVVHELQVIQTSIASVIIKGIHSINFRAIIVLASIPWLVMRVDEGLASRKVKRIEWEKGVKTLQNN